MANYRPEWEFKFQQNEFVRIKDGYNASLNGQDSPLRDGQIKKVLGCNIGGQVFVNIPSPEWAKPMDRLRIWGMSIDEKWLESAPAPALPASFPILAPEPPAAPTEEDAGDIVERIEEEIEEIQRDECGSYVFLRCGWGLEDTLKDAKAEIERLREKLNIGSGQ